MGNKLIIIKIIMLIIDKYNLSTIIITIKYLVVKSNKIIIFKFFIFFLVRIFLILKSYA
eukprot:NODE_8742_length_241_cov_38.703125_g7582_i0.p1 GENE.NODE_8742_length_241_cov_38.703125_g7582_i0~~NODE_8742_length_241_cov_38.703125_g7582_i0.p1  ORF type:complete len:67 (+),score=3.65 NODE_8742_length_241_cov_38.703125_g7582_i0:27-203(+)